MMTVTSQQGEDGLSVPDQSIHTRNLCEIDKRRIVFTVRPTKFVQRLVNVQ
jgi:hypothetical protein